MAQLGGGLILKSKWRRGQVILDALRGLEPKAARADSACFATPRYDRVKPIRADSACFAKPRCEKVNRCERTRRLRCASLRKQIALGRWADGPAYRPAGDPWNNKGWLDHSLLMAAAFGTNTHCVVNLCSCTICTLYFIPAVVICSL